MTLTSELVIRLSRLLKQQNKYFVTAESCTGGGVAFACTGQSGSSSWFSGSFVTYTNSMKQQALNVPLGVLTDHGAVSEPTVVAMLTGSLDAAKADIALAISGIAGPSGATESKPLGMVCFAYGSYYDHRSFTCVFEGDRGEVRGHAINKGLELVVDYLSTF